MIDFVLYASLSLSIIIPVRNIIYIIVNKILHKKEDVGTTFIFALFMQMLYYFLMGVDFWLLASVVILCVGHIVYTSTADLNSKGFISLPFVSAAYYFLSLYFMNTGNGYDNFFLISACIVLIPKFIRLLVDVFSKK